MVARAHPQWGEAVHAFVLLSRVGERALAGKDTEAATAALAKALEAHCRQHMSKFAVPKTYEIVTELPKTSTGSTLCASLTQKSRKRCCASASRVCSVPRARP